MLKKKHPKCIGFYDLDDDICDGDPDGETESDRTPCAFRDRCAALQKHCESKGYEPSAFVKQVKFEDKDGEKRTYAVAKGDDDTFAGQLAKWAKRWGIKNGRVTRTEPAKDEKPKKNKKKKKTRDVRDHKPPSADARKAAKEALAEKAEESLQEAYRFASWFTKCIQNETGRNVVGDSEAVSGEFFVIDRMEKSRYAALYCRKGKKGKIAVASIYPHTRNSTCQVRFSVEADDFDGLPNDYSKLGVSPINDGKFKSCTVKLGKEGISMASEAIARLIENGKIELPVE